MAGSTLYRVFLVEDEIVAREGMRDNVDWEACGFSFCGEASDGETALPLIQQTRPDVVLTDIRMPFMDGLQLCALLRDQHPQIHLIIYSGYDDFAYAQQAIALGVNEYLLKPVSVRDLTRTLTRMRALLDSERSEAENRRQLHSQLQDSRALLRQELLFRLALGDLEPYEAIEQSREAGIELVAPCYAVAVARLEPAQDGGAPDLRALQRAREALLQAAHLPQVHPFRKDIEELAFLVLGNDAADLRSRLEALREAGYTLLAERPALTLHLEAGPIQQRLSDLPLSFAAALDALALRLERTPPAQPSAAPIVMDRQAVERFLRLGQKEEFDSFFAAYVADLEEQISAVQQYRNFLLMDIAVATTTFVAELGGPPADVVPEAARIAELLAQVHAVDQMRDLARRMVHPALDYRDGVARQQHRALISRARAYIEAHFATPDLSLSTVAASVNVSPSHFSAVFSRETGETFKACLTRVRMEHARVLLRTTTLPILDVAQQCGYLDPHYFSAVFKRAGAVSPREYREGRAPEAEGAKHA